MASMKFMHRRSEERGHANHGWLKSFHTFSFAGYFDRNHESFGPLRVINEDRVDAYTGFDTHSHREFEIFSYIVSGQLEHKDSMGNVEVMKRGDIQMTSAGTGISHSEKAHGTKPVHFLQIWSKPWKSRLHPKYFTRHFTDDEKKDQWARVVAPVNAEGVTEERLGNGPAPVQSALSLYATILSKGKKLDKPLQGKKAYVHIIQTSGYKTGQADGATIRISSLSGDQLELKEGDGAYILVEQSGDVLEVENVGEKSAELLVFDLE